MTIYNMSANGFIVTYTANGKTLNANIQDNTYEFIINGVTVTTGTLTATTLNDDGVTDLFTLSGGNGEIIIFSEAANYTGTAYAGRTNQTEYFGTLFSSSSNIDTKMGDNYYEEDLTTGIKKYFAEAFSFDTDNFEMDGNRVVGLKQSFIDSLATDLTNIVNTSITTATLTADNATINDTLTALGIDVTGLLTAKGLDVGVDGLTIEDAQGRKHRLHLG